MNQLRKFEENPRQLLGHLEEFFATAEREPRNSNDNGEYTMGIPDDHLYYV